MEKAIGLNAALDAALASDDISVIALALARARPHSGPELRARVSVRLDALKQVLRFQLGLEAMTWKSLRLYVARFAFRSLMCRFSIMMTTNQDNSTACFDTRSIKRPSTYGPTVFADLLPIARAKQPAKEDVKYWEDAHPPWRDGHDAPITDPGVISREESCKLAAEGEDAAARWDAEALRCRGVRADWLLAITFELDLWDWKTWEVISFIVKPATETSGRCRFADLPFVKPFTGPATVFMSHCWGGLWGDLVSRVVECTPLLSGDASSSSITGDRGNEWSPDRPNRLA